MLQQRGHMQTRAGESAEPRRTGSWLDDDCEHSEDSGRAEASARRCPTVEANAANVSMLARSRWAELLSSQLR